MNITERSIQENIYRDAIEKIESLLSETSTEVFSDARITMLYQETKKQLASIREVLLKELQSLQEHAEWDSFTIAFYGETNAGKSTLIETLRILLHEETKASDRAIYDDAHKELTALQDKCSKIKQEISKVQEEKDSWIQETKKAYDIVIGDNKYRWNSTYDNWITTPNAVNEIGCIHTVQGYDLNYLGVIIGEDIKFDTATGQIYADKDCYFDQQGKSGVANDPEALREYLTNIYLTLMTRGIRGTYVYVCDPALREYMSQFIPSAT